MSVKRFIVAMLVLVMFSGCAPFQHSLKEGEALPDGKVLLVGAVVLDPPLEQGEMIHYDVRGASRGVVRFGVTKDLSQKVDMKATIPLSSDEVFIMNLKGISYIPLTPGTRYLRLGIMDESSHASMPVVIGGKSGFRGIDVQSLYLVKDIKVDLPSNAKAVYIGTLVFQHDGKQATGVRVRDDFKQATKDLAAKHIPGLTAEGMVRKLAQIVKN
ncbi:hypothetical protein [Geomonas propionica]|uniref:Lipoprotein n=1 Tax=Geomonas propionica TaxID=2798582 RepID=A0ABS0YKQ1_9BACT|nr:hypothetical protein [Geomonas propionica]MBJ6798540.1 hypothetical protein [Geomonas propionica]